MGNSVTIRKNQFKESADTVTFDIFSQGEKKQGFLVWFEGAYKAYLNQTKRPCFFSPCKSISNVTGSADCLNWFFLIVTELPIPSYPIKYHICALHIA